MKKTLAAVAILGAFAGSAMADVSVYGLVDLGIGYKNVDGVDTVEMKSGMDSASRVGFTASEKIGDVTVGVKLENSFDARTGNEGASGFFNRETRLYVKGAYGEVGFGRFGALDSTTGPYNLAGSSIHATTGINDIGSTGVIFLGQNSRLANTIAYVSPEFAGVKVYAQYASDSDNTHESNRYYALGARYTAGALTATLVGSLEDGADTAEVDASKSIAWAPSKDGVINWAGTKFNDFNVPEKDVTVLYGNAAKEAEKGEETKAITAAVSYDFGVTKLMFAAQYFDNVKAKISALAAKTQKEVTVDGFGVTLGAVTPVAGGKLVTQVGYMDSETEADKKYDAWNAGALYYYDLSKRTQVYGGVGYTVRGEEGVEDYKVVNGAIGMIHKF